jgi:hypothetical protein
MSDDLPAWYYEKAAHRARLALLEQRSLPAFSVPAPAEIVEAMQAVAEARKAGTLN